MLSLKSAVIHFKANGMKTRRVTRSDISYTGLEQQKMKHRKKPLYVPSKRRRRRKNRKAAVKLFVLCKISLKIKTTSNSFFPDSYVRNNLPKP